MSLVFWDTNLFIYLIEQHPTFGPVVEGIRERMRKRNDRLCTTALTIGECLTGPLLKGDANLASQYKAILRPPVLEVLDFGLTTSEHYARVRTNPSIRRADALQLACAAEAGVDLFLTNDRHLAKRVFIPGVQFIATLDNCPL